MTDLVMEVCVDSVDSAIAFVGALPSPGHKPTAPGLTALHDTIVIKTAPYEGERTDWNSAPASQMAAVSPRPSVCSEL